MYLQVILATLIISLISIIGIVVLILREQVLNKILSYLVALSAGVLLSTSFLHLLPEAVESLKDLNSISNIFLVTFLGFLVFFILEQTILWHHCHHGQHYHQKPYTYIILISDGLHNFIDGATIATAFLINPGLGITTTIAIALHEIPQEIGDFGVLVYSGMSKLKSLLANFISAFTAVFGGIITLVLYQYLQDIIVYLLPFSAGSFIYIAAADLIPEIKQENNKNFFYHLLIF